MCCNVSFFLGSRDKSCLCFFRILIFYYYEGSCDTFSLLKVMVQCFSIIMFMRAVQSLSVGRMLADWSSLRHVITAFSVRLMYNNNFDLLESFLRFSWEWCFLSSVTVGLVYGKRKAISSMFMVLALVTLI